MESIGQWWFGDCRVVIRRWMVTGFNLCMRCHCIWFKSTSQVPEDSNQYSRGIWFWFYPVECRYFTNLYGDSRAFNTLTPLERPSESHWFWCGCGTFLRLGLGAWFKHLLDILEWSSVYGKREISTLSLHLYSPLDPCMWWTLSLGSVEINRDKCVSKGILIFNESWSMMFPCVHGEYSLSCDQSKDPVFDCEENSQWDNGLKRFSSSKCLIFVSSDSILKI